MKLYNHEAEGMVLCSFMLDKTSIDRFIHRIKTSDFTNTLHKDVFSIISLFHKNNTHIDLVSVGNELSKIGRDNKSIAEFARISSMTYTSSGIDYYVEVIKDLSMRREALEICEAAKLKIERHDIKGREICNDIEKDISRVNLGDCVNDYQKAKEFIPKIGDEIQENIETQGKVRGVESPFKSLNEITPFNDGEVTYIGARPSQGKTALALNLIEDISIRRKIPSGIFSVEMTGKQLNYRLLTSISKIPSFYIKMGLLKKKDIDRLFTAMAEIYEAPLFIDETSGIRISELKTKARKMVKVDKVKIIFIDYLGLINDEQPKMPRHEQIADISRELKGLAKELNIPFVVLAQLKRDAENKVPSLSDLKESGAIEQDADVVMFIHRDRGIDDKEAQNKDEIPTDLIVAKDRNGPVGVSNLIFKPKLTKFVDPTNGIDSIANMD